MEVVTRALHALARGIGRLWQYWMADIGKRKSLGGKVASIAIGLFAICCVCSVGLSVTGSAGQAVGLVATNNPLSNPNSNIAANAHPSSDDYADTGTDRGIAPN